MRTELLTGLPIINVGPNVGRLDRISTAEMLGLTRRQVSKAYNNWIQIFRMKDSTLTFAQYLAKLNDAGITPDSVGMRAGQYQLARYGDVGCYTSDNCRFITREENRAEQSLCSGWTSSVKPGGLAANF